MNSEKTETMKKFINTKIEKYLKSKGIEIISDSNFKYYIHVEETNPEDEDRHYPNHYVVTFDGKFIIEKKKIR